ncbi:MAG: mycofactocin biosynthesis glycosyltransferase MftF [Microbacterium sp.]
MTQRRSRRAGALAAPPRSDPSAALPEGATVRLSAHTRQAEDGAVLVGGVPTRVTRLKRAARGLIRDRSLEVTDRASRALAAHLVDAGHADPDPDTLPAADVSALTVVVPAFGRARALGRLLGSVRADLGDVRIIVVDDGSTDRDAAEITRVADAADAETVVLEANRGPAEARNAGLERVETPFVLFCDTDVVLGRGSVARLLRHFADPLLALAAPRVRALRRERAWEGPKDSWILRYEEARSSLDHGPDPSLVRPHSPVSWVSSTCLVARVDALRAPDGDDGFGAGMRVAEDVDLVWRLVEAGWRVRYEPRAKVAREHRGTVRSWLGRKFVYGTGTADLARRHPGLAAPAVLAPWTAGVLAAVAAQRRWSLPLACAITIVATARIARRLPAGEEPGARTDRVALASELAVKGVGSTLAQGSALAVRHWWPLFAIGSLFSLRVRRIVVVSAIADAAVEFVRLRPRIDIVRFFVARRLDDAAYGAGVWWSAIRARSVAALLPAVRTGRSRAGRAGRAERG